MLISGSLIVSIVAVFTTDAFVLFERTHVTQISKTDAIEQFRRNSRQAAVADPTDPTDPTTTAPSARTTPPGPSAINRAPSATTIAPKRSSPNPAAPTTRPAVPPTGPSGAPPPQAMRRPTPGVYSYATSGYETLSVGQSKHTFPPETQAIVTLGSGCQWTLKMAVVKESTDTLSYCQTPNRLSWLEWRLERDFFTISSTFDYLCPADNQFFTVPPSARYSMTCAAESDSVLADIQALEQRVVTIDGKAITGQRIVVDGTLSGGLTGKSHLDLLIDPATGLRLHESRVIDARANGATYHEEAEFDLRSLTPNQ